MDKLAERRSRMARLRPPPRGRSFAHVERAPVGRPANDNGAPLLVRLAGYAIGGGAMLLVLAILWFAG